jgi:hypothetical protein
MPSDDPRYQNTEQRKGSILEHYNEIANILRPIRNRILVALAGNHDYRSTRFGNFVKDTFCHSLKIPYGTTAAKVIVDDKQGRLQYKMFAYHPFTGSINSSSQDPIMREAVMVSQMKRKLVAQRMGDCVLQLVAHFHKALIARPFHDLYLIDDGNRIKQRYHKEADPRASFIPEDSRWYGSVPGYQRKHIMGESGYVERAGYTPVELGALRATIEAGKVSNLEKRLV